MNKKVFLFYIFVIFLVIFFISAVNSFGDSYDYEDPSGCGKEKIWCEIELKCIDSCGVSYPDQESIFDEKMCGCVCPKGKDWEGEICVDYDVVEGDGKGKVSLKGDKPRDLSGYFGDGKSRSIVGKDVTFSYSDEECNGEIESKCKTLTFNEGGAVSVVRKGGALNTFKNVKPADDETEAFVTFNDEGKIVAFKGTFTEDTEVYIGDTPLYVKKGSKVVFDESMNQAKVIIPGSFDPENIPSYSESKKEGEYYGVKVEVIPNNEKSDLKMITAGTIFYRGDGEKFIPENNFVTVGGLTAHAKEESVNLKFGDKGFLEDADDADKENYVRFPEDKGVKFGGDVTLEFEPDKFVNGDDSVNLVQDLSFAGAKNKKYYKKGDRGSEVIKIQSFLEIENPSGVYDEETIIAVRDWQEDNGLTKDGNFGKKSLTKATIGDVRKKLAISSQGGVVEISQEKNSVSLGLSDGVEFNINGGNNNLNVRQSKNDFFKIDFGNSKNGKSFNKGDSGGSVKEIQRMLISEGYLSKYSPSGKPEEDGIYGSKTIAAVKKWQKEKGLPPSGKFDVISNNKIAEKNVGAIYKEIRPKFANSFDIPIKVVLKDSNGDVAETIFPVEGPGALETLKSFYEKGVQNKGYFTGKFKTSKTLNTVLFDNIPSEGSLTSDSGIISDTIIRQDYLNQMDVYVKTISKDTAPNERFNLIVRKAGEVTKYNPDNSLKLVSIFGVRYKDLSPNFQEGFGNRHIVNGKDSTKYKKGIPAMSSVVSKSMGVPQDGSADKKYRLVTIAGQSLYSPDSYFKEAKIAFEHTSYEVMALAGRTVREAKTGKIPAYGSGDTGDIKADFGGAKLGKDLDKNPEETLKNFNFEDYFS